jgi:hypothetical protein
MRAATLLLLLLTGSCTSASAVPVVGADADVVLSNELLTMASTPASACLCATDAAQWRALRRVFGGDVATQSADYATWPVERVVAVGLPRGSTLRRIVVGTEEGVDVVTLVCDPVGPPVRFASVLRVARRPHQLAVVVRVGAGEETTVGVFDAEALAFR